MKSSLTAAIRNVSMVLASIAFVAVSLFVSAKPAHALTISVGTPTVVSSVTVDQWSAVTDNQTRLQVVYSTSNATTYSIMYASSSLTNAGGYSYTTISTGPIANKPLYLTLLIDNNNIPHVYYYDASSTTINSYTGSGNFAQAAPVFLLGTEKVTASGLSAASSGSGFILAFSSQAAVNNYKLVLTSATFGAVGSTDAVVSGFPVTVVSTAGITGSGDVTSGKIAVFFNSTNGKAGVIYFDDAATALKLVYVAAGVLDESSRETLDLGTFSNIYVTDSGNITRIVYNDSSSQVKYAIQRRLISAQCWYIEKIDDGAAAGVLANNVSYIKSGSLYLAKGQAGTFFDDFTESITNAQRGKAALVASVTKGYINATPAQAATPRGIYQPSATNGGLNTINWLTLSGSVNHSIGATAIPAVKVRGNVTDAGLSGKVVDLDPSNSSETSGALTNGAGAYQINVASGVTLTVTPSSSPWVFVYVTSPTTNVSTSTIGDYVGGGLASVNFLAVSTPVLLGITPSSASVSGINTGAPGSVTFAVNSASSSLVLANGFAAGAVARLVPQSAQGTLPTITVSTAAEAGSFILQGGASAVDTFNGSTNTIWNSFASTAIAGAPKYYTLVVTTITQAGHIMQASKVDAFELRAMEIGIASGTMARTMPGLTVETSTGLFNNSVNTTIIVRSSSPYIRNFNPSLLANGNIYLTSSTVLTGVAYSSDVLMGFAGTLGTDNYGGGSQFFYATAAIHGINPGTYYVRIGSRPANTDNVAQPQFALSNAVTISSPAITNVVAENGVDSVITATASINLHVYGRGFLSTSTIVMSTSTTLIGGLPGFSAGNVTFAVRTSTFADAQITLVNNNVSNGPFYLYIASANINGAPGSSYVRGPAGVDMGGFVGSTVVARTETALITVSSMAVFSVSPSANVSNTRLSPQITIYGRGLRGGSTVQFMAIDGSTGTAPVAVNEAAAAFGLNKLTVDNVDFRSPIFGGKTFMVVVTTVSTNDAAVGLNGSTVSISAQAGSVLTVSSLTVSSLVMPAVSTAGVYNSTGSVGIGMYGIGLATGTQVTIHNLLGSFQVTIGAISSTGAYANFISTAFYNAAAGTYSVGVGTTVLRYGGSDTFVATTTINITVLNSTVTSISADGDLVSSVRRATFTIVGTGLQAGTTVELFLASGGTTTIRNPALEATKVAAGNFQDLTSGATQFKVWFDLRGATATATNWNARITLPQNIGVVFSSAVERNVVLGGISISSIPTITNAVLSSSSNASGNTSVTLTGTGLSSGMQLSASFVSSSSLSDISGIQNVDTNTRVSTITTVSNDGRTATATGLSLTAAAPGVWRFHVSTTIVKEFNPDGYVTSPLSANVTYSDVNDVQFSVLESSAPNAPTGLTVLSAGVKTVTLRWIAPGDDGSTGSMTTGSKFVIYISSGEDIRGQGCAACYPVGAVDGTAGYLTASATNYTFDKTWAQHLPFGYANSAVSTTAAAGSAYYASTASARGITVTTQTIAIANLDSPAGATSIAPGTTVQATLTVDPGAKDANFFFVVRAVDEAGNLSPVSGIIYSTASARIRGSAGAAVAAGDPVINPNADNTVTYTITEVVVGGVTVKELKLDTPAGALDGADTFSTPVVNTTPASDSGGVEGVGSALDIKLASGKTEFKKAITITVTVDEAQLLAKLAGRSISLVKLAFYNGSRWVILADSSYGTAGRVSGRTTHLTEFRAVIASPPTNLSGVSAYPNPYRPSIASHLAQKVTFDNVPANTNVSIYTITGELVKRLKDDDGNGIVTWDAKNENGDDVASGVYFVLLKSASDSKTLKFAVQR